MDKYPLAVAAVASRDDERLSINYKADVADETFVENGVDLLFVVDAALGEPAHLRPFGGRVGFHDWFECTTESGCLTEPLLLSCGRPLYARRNRCECEEWGAAAPASLRRMEKRDSRGPIPARRPRAV